MSDQDMRKDKGAYESEEVESCVAGHLKSLRGESDEDLPTPDSDDTEPNDDDTSTSNEDDDVDLDWTDDDDDADGDDDTEEETEASDADDDLAAIPENVLRSLEHNEWTPDDIAEFWKADKKKAMKVFKRIHKATNDMSKQFAQIGRTRMQMDRQNAQRQNAQQDVGEQEDFVDIETLRKADPDNELLPVVEGLNKALKKLIPARREDSTNHQGSEEIRRQQDLSLATQVVNFLGSDQMKGYLDFYGPAFDQNRMPIFDKQNLTHGQAANRDALLNRADEIWIGAKLHGRELTVAEALQMAHSMLTENVRSTAIRNDLINKVKKRAKGMTLRPNSGRKPSLDSKPGKPKSDGELESRTEQRLRKLRHKS